ncbi:MAG: hypothetical protein E6Q30_02630 [Aquabacterium sp.]|nr:MAG: hypothetical protein E6Q30_02630 [Aquabacterium sp.]
MKASLAQHGLSPTVHIQLAQRGVKKVYRTDFDEDQARELLPELRQQVQALNAQYAAQTAHRSAPGG